SIFGGGKNREVGDWESVKVAGRREEEEDGVTVIHERERFSQRLTLLYADGRISLLSEKPTESTSRKEERDAECALTHGQADLCASGPGHDYQNNTEPE